MTIYRSEVTAIGSDAGAMLDGGVLIFFAEPCPDALAEVSVVHRPEAPPAREPRPGDVIAVGGETATISRIGELAANNLRELGHIVIYLDPAESVKLLPGAVHASGALGMPAPGAVLTITEGDSAS